MLLDHLGGILNYCRTKVPLGVVEAVNGNIKALLRRGRGYKNLRYLLLKAQRMAALKTEFVAFRKAAYNAGPVEFLRRAHFSCFTQVSAPTRAQSSGDSNLRGRWHYLMDKLRRGLDRSEGRQGHKST